MLRTNLFIFIVLFVGGFLFTGCKEQGCTDPKAANYNPDAKEEDGSCTFDKTDDIVELAIRQVKPDQQTEFETARANFISLLTQEDYVYNDREYASFYHFNPTQDSTRAVYVGMTQYEDLETFQAVGNKLGTAPEAAAFFSTFDPLVFTAMKPLQAGTPVDLTQLAKAGQVLEVAVRDLSLYPNFDQANYNAKRDAFLALLAQQPGQVAEYQWVSVLEPSLVVGMTVYESQQAFFAIASNPDFAGDPAVGAFFGTYPPNRGGEVCTVVN